MTVPQDYAYLVPSGFSDESAAPLLCPGAIGYRALRLTRITDGQPRSLGPARHQRHSQGRGRQDTSTATQLPLTSVDRTGDQVGRQHHPARHQSILALGCQDSAIAGGYRLPATGPLGN